MLRKKEFVIRVLMDSWQVCQSRRWSCAGYPMEIMVGGKYGCYEYRVCGGWIGVGMGEVVVGMLWVGRMDAGSV